MDAGEFKNRVQFERLADQAPDELGNVQGAPDPVSAIERAAKFILRPGSEAMIAARLAGRQPMDVIVRFDSQTSQITAIDWRMTDVRTGKVYAIQSAADMQVEGPRKYMTFGVEGGVAP
ncbi:phage head completion protein [Lichenihabitans psoromatis]|uniref:phage head completion protein n=1 Tax=Lichenihabitans psoromatis TaxID=2528642 RepID=UPI0010385A00|nr:head-tail adaptor protein [Lichenihabitans psoromatis]